EKFTADTGIKVNFTFVPYQGVFDKFSSEISSGSSAFDVVTIDVVWNAKFSSHIEDLSALFTDLRIGKQDRRQIRANRIGEK
ncbi:extracellular solute-binding protein, partial [Rhizobium ruizarguesonis]